MKQLPRSPTGLWRARCIERCPPGSGSGPGKRASRKAGTAPRADFHRPSPPLICRFIDEMRAVGYAVESICTVLRGQGVQVAARTYRAWKKRLPALRTLEDAKITDVLRALKAKDAKGLPRPEIIYWLRKMTAWLRRNGFPEASKHTVDRLMRDERMNGLVRGRKTRTTIPGKDGRRAGDLLNRSFSSPAPNQVWVTDFTYVPVYTGFVYVALVIDLYSRAIVGWETSTNEDTTFVEQCLRMALWRRQHPGRPVPEGLIHHSEHGAQYTSRELGAWCTGNNVHQLMGLAGVCWDCRGRVRFLNDQKRVIPPQQL